MQHFLIFLILITTASCQNQIKAKFTVTNCLNYTLDSVEVKSATESSISNCIRLKPNETKIYYLDMTNLPKNDGHYLLSYKAIGEDTIKVYPVGYYTNGAPSESNINLLIYPNILVRESEFDHY